MTETKTTKHLNEIVAIARVQKILTSVEDMHAARRVLGYVTDWNYGRLHKEEMNKPAAAVTPFSQQLTGPRNN